jgi:hypothetical protein
VETKWGTKRGEWYVERKKNERQRNNQGKGGREGGGGTKRIRSGVGITRGGFGTSGEQTHAPTTNRAGAGKVTRKGTGEGPQRWPDAQATQRIWILLGRES